MTVLLDRKTLKARMNQAQSLFWLTWAIVFLSLVVEMFWGDGVIIFDLACVIGSILIYRSNLEVFNKLQYSFWSFIVGMILFNFWLISSTELVIVQQLSVVSIFLFLALANMMNSPLLYPRITWWEYDFRFRGELKIWAHLEDRCVQGRMTDLRKKAGCVVLFERLLPGEEFDISYQFGKDALLYKVKVITRREAFFGRGYIYGVSFEGVNQTKDEKKKFKRLSRIWRVKRRVKKELKYKT